MIGTAIGLLVTSGCADFDRPAPDSFGSVQIAERSDRETDTDRALQIWIRVAEQAMENGHPDTAIRFAQKAARAFPDSDEPVRLLALAYHRKNDESRTGSARPATAAAPSTYAAPVDVAPKSRLAMGPAASERRTVRAPVFLVKQGARPKPPAFRAGHSPGYRVQLAAYADFNNALRGKRILARRLPGDFPSLGIFMRPQSLAQGKRINYRLRSRDLTYRSQATDLCRAVKASGLSCLPIRRTGDIWQLVEHEGDRRMAGSGRTMREKMASPERKPAAPAATGGGPLFRVQLAAYQDLARAVRGKRILTASLPGNFPPLEILKMTGNADRFAPIHYWVRSQGSWAKSRALEICDQARSSGHDCFLKKADSTTWQPVMASR
jgi:hypothetical protein